MKHKKEELMAMSKEELVQMILDIDGSEKTS